MWALRTYSSLRIDEVFLSACFSCPLQYTAALEFVLYSNEFYVGRSGLAFNLRLVYNRWYFSNIYVFYGLLHLFEEFKRIFYCTQLVLFSI